MILKFIIYSIIIIYLVSKLIGFLFRFWLKTVGQKAQRSFNQSSAGYRSNDYRKSTAQDEINIEYIPKDKKGKKEFKGGEYVDYEEVK